MTGPTRILTIRCQEKGCGYQATVPIPKYDAAPRYRLVHDGHRLQEWKDAERLDDGPPGAWDKAKWP